MTMKVSTSDLLGTALTSAQVAAMELRTVRESTTQAGERTMPLDRAIAELVQALAETVIGEQYATSRDSITTREHDFGAQCEYAEQRIRAAVAVFRMDG